MCSSDLAQAASAQAASAQGAPAQAAPAHAAQAHQPAAARAGKHATDAAMQAAEEHRARTADRVLDEPAASSASRSEA